MRRCRKHVRYGCTDYECQRAETARNADGPATELRDTPPGDDAAVADSTTTSSEYDRGGTLPAGGTTAVNRTGEPVRVVRGEES